MKCLEKNKYIKCGDYYEMILDKDGLEIDRCKIDIEDYYKCRDYRWYKYDGYVYSGSGPFGDMTKLHRYIMDVRDSKYKVDHIYHNKMDNRKSMLRVCTNSQNCMNRRGVKGISYSKRDGWRAYIKINGKQICKYCKSEREAKNVRANMVRQYFGEYGVIHSEKV